MGAPGRLQGGGVQGGGVQGGGVQGGGVQGGGVQEALTWASLSASRRPSASVWVRAASSRPLRSAACRSRCRSTSRRCCSPAAARNSAHVRFSSWEASRALWRSHTSSCTEKRRCQWLEQEVLVVRGGGVSGRGGGVSG